MTGQEELPTNPPKYPLKFTSVLPNLFPVGEYPAGTVWQFTAKY